MNGGANSSELPFFVYGTLRPGERNHAPFLEGRLDAQEPAVLLGALLIDGPGYPYVIESGSEAGTRSGTKTHRVLGEVLHPAPGAHAELLARIDRLEDYRSPGHARNLYERVVRDVFLPHRTPPTAIQAWVYVAAPRVARELRSRGRVITGGDWTAQHASPAVRNPHPNTEGA